MNAVEPLTIRMPVGMRDQIRRRAAASRRSMNSEIVHYLDCALSQWQPAEVEEEAFTTQQVPK